ncbi:MAG: TOBE domain-containing protein [Amphritea sp.]|nr:TOBE domain-containing protein [Amphritea sp.]
MTNSEMNLEAQLILNLDQKMFANPRRMALLAAIAQAGSVSQGAKLAGMSYKAAWDAVNDMNQRADEPLLSLAVGGKGGGGAELTAMGERLLKLYGLLNDIQQRAVVALQDRSVPLESLLGAISQFSVQSSARNQYLGRVDQLVPSSTGEVTVTVALESGLRISASITDSSCERLKLDIQREVMALIKAPSVILDNASVQDTGLNCYLAEVISVCDQDLVLRMPTGDMLYARISAQPPEKGQTVVVRIDPAQVMLAAITP